MIREGGLIEQIRAGGTEAGITDLPDAAWILCGTVSRSCIYESEKGLPHCFKTVR